MFNDINARDYLDNPTSIKVEIKEVNYCPLCHKYIKPTHIGSFLNGISTKSDYLQRVYRCPNCGMIFLALFNGIRSSSVVYDSDHSWYSFERVEPFRPSEPSVPEYVRQISPSFCEVYAQAKSAEDQGLKDICGMGYRKALEFLIKDYLIHRQKDLEIDAEMIIRTSLSNCIKKYISDAQIKESSELAAWLGNDETHYYKKWVNKDLSDLKILLEITINSIYNNLILEKQKKDMKPKS